MSEKKPPACELILKFGNGASSRYPMEQLLSALGLLEMPDEIRIGMSRGSLEMHAAIHVKESAYPGITVDASTPQAGNIYLGNFELPSEDYPTRLTARLYAGCEKYETDEPIAIATHEVTDDAGVIWRASKHKDPRRRMHKLVYVDRKLAGTRNWSGSGEENMPEHEEDEC